ncbi:MAG: HIT domain-containing protein [Pseudomonadota bacterium]
MMTYDPENIFAKILRGDIPNDTVYESDHSLAFNDIAPQAPMHVLVIPKGAYVDHADFSANASPEELTDFHRTVATVIQRSGADAAGFRTISNAGEHGMQEVPHFHLHILAGKVMGPLLAS